MVRDIYPRDGRGYISELDEEDLTEIGDVLGTNYGKESTAMPKV